MKQNHASTIELFLLALFCLFFCFSFGFKYLNEDNYNYAIEEIHAFDNTVFSENINTVGSSYSPRFFSNQIASIIMKLTGISWFGFAAILIRINYLLFAVASFTISINFAKQNRLLCGIVVSNILMVGSFISLGFSINEAQDVFLDTALPISIIGISEGLKDRPSWITAWVLVSISCFLHIHEGMWAGCIVGVIWLSNCLVNGSIVKKRIIGLFIFSFSLLIVVLPSLIKSTPVDENLFVQIYAFIRTPHHLIISSWGRKTIIQAAIQLSLCAVTIYFYYKKCSPKEIKATALLIIIMALLWLFLLIAEYYFTEIHPNSSVVSMYLPKCFKYISLVASLLIIKIGFYLLEAKRYLLSLPLISALVIPPTGVFYSIQIVCYVVFILFTLFDKTIVSYEIDDSEDKSANKVLFYLFVFFLSYIRTKTNLLIYLFFCILLFEFLSDDNCRKRILDYIILFFFLVSVIISTNDFIIHLSPKGISYIGGEEYAARGIDSSIFSLAKEFKEKIPGEVVFLADPDSQNSNAFQLISQKSCFALWKNTPSNKNSVIEWYNRILAAREALHYSPGELDDFMEQKQIGYVLVSANRFDELAQSPLFEAVCKNDAFAMYKRTNTVL